MSRDISFFKPLKHYDKIISLIFLLYLKGVFKIFSECIIEKKSNNRSELLDKIVSLSKRRGFVFQSSEIYGGLNGCWDYGPLGVELLKNVKEEWWKVHDLP